MSAEGSLGGGALILDAHAVDRLLDTAALVDGLERAFVELSRGEVSSPSRTAAVVEATGGLIGSMLSYVPSTNLLCAKLVTVFPPSAAASRPTHQAVIAVFSPDDGALLAVLDGTVITARRTAAASALATRLLARRDAATVAVVGTGVQAEAHARALATTIPVER